MFREICLIFMEVNVMEVYENGVLKRLFELQIDEIPNLQVYLTTILTVWAFQILVGTIARKTILSPTLVGFSGGMPGSVINTQTIFDIFPRKLVSNKLHLSTCLEACCELV
jgi:hypothetical protein